MLFEILKDKDVYLYATVMITREIKSRNPSFHYLSVSVVTQRSWGGGLRDATKNGCVADYSTTCIKQICLSCF